MPACTASGFGIFVKAQGGRYQFLKFDQRGSELALKAIVFKTAKSDHLSVEVTGRLLAGAWFACLVAVDGSRRCVLLRAAV